MQTYAASEAKAHLSQILDEVEEGKKVVISRHGQSIAILEPYPQIEKKENKVAEAIDAIKVMRKGVTLGGLSIRYKRHHNP
jgi:prevent-host-death family protein